MKFLRYGSPGDEKPGFIDENGRIRDLSDQLTDLEGVNLEPERLAALAKFDPSTLPVVEGTMRMGVPVAGVGKIVAVGLNYRDHAEETGMDLPNEPVLFSKAITALNAPMLDSTTMRPVTPHTRAISSITSTASNKLRPCPPSSVGIVIPRKPSRLSFSTVSQGYSSVRSTSAAAGAATSVANCRARSRSEHWSLVNRVDIVG